MPKLKPSLYWLLVFVPLSLVAELVHQPVAVFVTSCLAIVPLAGLIGKATEQLAERSGPMVGGLLNATFGNVTELIIGILLVWAGEFEVVKASLIGSILGNLVLVLGASYLLGGLRHRAGGQRFDAKAARAHSTSLLLAVTGMVMPAVFVLSQNNPQETPMQREVVSVVVALVLVSLYLSSVGYALYRGRFNGAGGANGDRQLVATAGEAPGKLWSARRAVLVLLATAIVVGIQSELLVGSLEPALAALHLPRVFVGLFVIAFIGNVAEHASAVTFALRNKMDISIQIAFNSSTQIAMLVAPLLVFVSLLAPVHMDFIFIATEVVAVTLATLIVSVIAVDGRSNWLEGAQLLGVYVILAASTFFVTA